MNDPLDPFGFFGQQRAVVKRMTAQSREAVRQAKLTASRADVDAAYVAFRNHSDRESATNLRDAVEVYLSVASGE
jgi:hypothetical protein